MRLKLEELSIILLAATCFCAIAGCQSGRPTRIEPTYSELPPQAPKLAPDEVPSSKWSAAIQALKPIKVYVDGSNLVVVQKAANGIESGKYIIEPWSSHSRPSWRFTKFTPAVAGGFSPLAEIYDYERSQP
jgi:hypothetical protein